MSDLNNTEKVAVREVHAACEQLCLKLRGARALGLIVSFNIETDEIKSFSVQQQVNLKGLIGH